MSFCLTLRDETTAGERHDACTLEFPTETITVRELIRGRVFQEVQDFNVADNKNEFRGLVQPTDTERAMNGYKVKPGRQLDWQKQLAVALEAFDRNGFIILVNDRQLEALDDSITLGRQTTVTFLKLVPLVGG